MKACAWLTFVTLVVCGTAVSAAAPASARAATTAAATRPLSKESRPYIRDFYRRICVDAYDAVGKRDARWDDAARRLLAAGADDMSLGPTPLGDEEDVIYHASVLTRKSRCDDPLVLYITADNLAEWNRSFDRISDHLFRAAGQMPHSLYHPLLKARVLARSAQYRARVKSDLAASLEKGKGELEEALALIPQIVADREVPRYAIYQLFEMIGYASIRLTNDRQTYAAKAFKILDQHCPHDRSLVMTVMARFYTEYAWDARGQAFADDVPEDAMKEFGDRLQPARVAAEEAWNLDNDNAFAAIAMQRLCVAMGGDGIDLWSERAIAAAPDSFGARHYRLLALEPKWYGSIQQMRDFARKVADEGDYDAGLPLILVKAHLDAARYRDDGGYAREPQPAYFANNPRAWEDVRSVYVPYLERFPRSLYHRSRFAQIAAWAGQWQEADKQLRAMGDDFSYTWFRTRGRYQALRAEVATRVAAADTTPQPAAPPPQ